MQKDQPNESYFQSLLARYREGKLLPEEQEFLERYYDLYEEKGDLIREDNRHEFESLKNDLKARIDRAIEEERQKASRKRLTSFRNFRYAVAALLLLSFSLGIYFITRIEPVPPRTTASAAADIAPGSNRAVLSLGTRATIDLNDRNSARLLEKEGISIGKSSDGRIQYKSVAQRRNGTPEIHTISTPNGGQYEVLLPDGSLVFLNAGSTLRFPAWFQGTTRFVELEGEAYFEVQGNKSMPFIVQSGGQQVEVLGTKFAVNAYKGESSIRTTLLEGSVNVRLEAANPASGKSTLQLSPGEQAMATQGTNPALSKAKVDVQKATAWKDGLFSFENDELRTIMKQIARWYDLEVIYEGRIPQEKFFGEISRESRLSDVLAILEFNNILFRLEGRTLYVAANPNSSLK